MYLLSARALERGIVFVALFAIVGAGVSFLPQLGSIQDIQVFEYVGNEQQNVREGKAEVYLSAQYPPLANAMFWFINVLPGRFDVSWLFAVLTAILVSCWYSAHLPHNATRGYALPLAIFMTLELLGPDLVYARFDIFIGLLIFLALATFRAKKFSASTAFIVLAGLLKIVPLLLLPLFLILAPDTRSRIRIGITTLLWTVALSALPILLIGPGNVWKSIQTLGVYQGDRGTQVESVWSTPLMLQKALTGEKSRLEFHHLAIHNETVPDSIPSFSGALLIAGAVGLYWFALKHKNNASMEEQVEVIIVLFLVVTPVLSPQFLIWLTIPMLAFALTHSNDSHFNMHKIMLLGTICITTHWLYSTPARYAALIDEQTLSSIILVNIRNALLIVLMAVYVLHLYSSATQLRSRLGTHIPIPAAPRSLKSQNA